MENSEAENDRVADDDGNLYYSDVAPLVYPTKSGEAIAILRSYKHRVRYGFHARFFFPQSLPRLLGAIGMKSILQARRRTLRKSTRRWRIGRASAA